jgi:predicted DNA-binding protein
MDLENTAVLNVRISEQLKQQLEQLAKEKNETISDYVRKLLTKHVLQDDDYVSGISQETMKQIEAEAKRRGITTTDLMARLVVAAFGRLRKGSPNIFVLD